MIVHSYDVEKSIQYVLELNCIKLRNIATKQRAKKYLKGCTMRKKIITSLTIITCLFSICPIAQAEEIPDLTADQKQLLYDWNAMDEHQKELVKAYIQGIIRK